MNVTVSLGIVLGILLAATTAWSADDAQVALAGREFTNSDASVSAPSLAGTDSATSTDMSLCPNTICRPTAGSRDLAGLGMPSLGGTAVQFRSSGTGRTPTRLMKLGQLLGIHLHQGLYATIGLRPIFVIDPASAERSPTDRVDIGLRYVVNF